MLKVFLATIYITTGFFFVIGVSLFVLAVCIKIFGSYK